MQMTKDHTLNTKILNLVSETLRPQETHINVPKTVIIIEMDIVVGWHKMRHKQNFFCQLLALE